MAMMWCLFQYYFPKGYLLSIAGVLLLFLLWGFSHSEAYFNPYPTIDTRFSKAFTEAKFERITPGMSEDELTQLMGKPLTKEDREGGLSIWSYSSDGKCLWGDFAWMGRSVTCKDGKVVRMEKAVFYD